MNLFCDRVRLTTRTRIILVIFVFGNSLRKISYDLSKSNVRYYYFLGNYLFIND